MNQYSQSPGHRRHYKRHNAHAQRSAAGSGSGNSSNSNKYVRECACGRGLACVGMTQAFRLLGDPRCYYVELPRYRKNPPAYKYTFRNNLRAAYIRHLQVLNPSLNLEELENAHERRYVALHHFHPAVVKAFYENPLTSGAARKHKVPISITEHELQELNMDIHQEDRILSITGSPTGGYYFCPSYPQEKAHEDLKQLIKLERANREAKAESDQQSEEYRVPGNIEISEPQLSAGEAQIQSAASVSPEHPRTGNVHEPEQPNESVGKDGNVLVGNQGDDNDLEMKPVVVPDDDSSRGAVPASDDIKIDTDDAEAVEEGEFNAIPDDDSSTGAIPAFDDIKIDKEGVGTEEEEEFNAVLSENIASEFDTLWAEDDHGIAGTNGPEHAKKWHNDAEGDTDVHRAGEPMDARGSVEASEIIEETTVDQGSALSSQSGAMYQPPKGAGRDTDHPWETPKYRRHLERPEPLNRMGPSPAHFIDPAINSLSTRYEATVENHEKDGQNVKVSAERTGVVTSMRDGEGVAGLEAEKDSTVTETRPSNKRTPDAASAAQKSAAAISAAALMAMKSIDEVEEGAQKSSLQDTSQVDDQSMDPPGWSGTENGNDIATPPRIQRAVDESRSFDDNRSQESDDSFATAAIVLKHNFPGTDPTLRIQVHNDLIAWESKRRSDMSEQLRHHGDQWESLRNILREGLEEVEFAERFVSGFAKAGSIFADSSQAVYDDKLLDDAGNAVNNSFLRNRLYKKRNVEEYSIESQDTQTSSGQSVLLNSILEAQVEIAGRFRDSSIHIEQEILPEIQGLRQEILAGSKEFESLGESILVELKRSEAELKNIWDVFDAMVTGDLMEYTVHGSMHGGSQHGGSFHSSLGPSTGSLHGFLTPQGEGPVVSSVHSPMVRSTFRQLGAIEDGWLVEMYYRSAVAYQQAVFGVAENQLNDLTSEIMDLEERRFRKLREVMLAFVPRQRRLFNSLPEQLRGVLDDLVGLRIDEETLQTVVDEAIKDRSHDHLKRGASHRSSIMNRSRVNKAKEAEEAEVENIESAFGSPFKSSRVLLSKVVELQPGGFRGMVNTSWKTALVVVTAEGNFHVFILPEEEGSSNSPFEAFKSLCPPMELHSASKWIRKTEISKSLTPTISMNLKDATFTIMKMQNRQLQVVEEKPQGENGGSDSNSNGRNRFMKAMKAAADSQRSKRCTLRLSSAAEVTEWINLLQRTKKVLRTKDASNKPSHFDV